MEKEVQKFVDAIRWLAEGGRLHATLLATRVDSDEQFESDLEEAQGWINDLADGNEI